MIKIFIISILIFFIPITSYSFEGGVSATQSWNDSAGFPTTYERLAKTTIAEAIEKKRGGYYNGWDQTNYIFYNTAIGAQIVISESKLEDVQMSIANCGNSTAQTSLEATGNAVTDIKSGPCEIEN